MWLLQMPDAQGVGATRINVSVQHSSGVRTVKTESGVLLREGTQEERLLQAAGPASWHADAEVPAGKAIWLKIAYEPVPMAPLWLVQISLGTALLSLGFSGYLLWRSRQRPASAAQP